MSKSNEKSKSKPAILVPKNTFPTQENKQKITITGFIATHDPTVMLLNHANHPFDTKKGISEESNSVQIGGKKFERGVDAMRTLGT